MRPTSLRNAAILLLTGASCAVACATLPVVDANQCGNGVLEGGEECDPAAPLTEGKCGAGGTPHACRFVCNAEAPCPSSYGCGVDAVCRKATGTFGAGRRIPGELSELELGDFDGDGRQDIVVQGKTALRINYLDAQGSLAKTTTLPVTRGRFTTESLSTDKLATITLLDTELSGGATGGGLAVYRGKTDRTVVPNIYPFVPINGSDPMPIPARLGQLGRFGVGQEFAAISDTSAFARERGKAYSVLFYDLREDGSNETIPMFPLPALDKWLGPNPGGGTLPNIGTGLKQIEQPIPGKFIVTNEAGFGPHACETIIITVRDPSVVEVLPLCLRKRVADWRTPGAYLEANTPNIYPFKLGAADTRQDPGAGATPEPRIPLALPANHRVAGPATIASVNAYGIAPGLQQAMASLPPPFQAALNAQLGNVPVAGLVSLFGPYAAADALPDVLVPTVGGAAIGFGDGTGHTRSIPSASNDDGLATYPGIAAPAGEGPLALGDLNGDGVVDWVDSAGIHFNTAAYDKAIEVVGPTLTAAWPDSDPNKAATITKIVADGLMTPRAVLKVRASVPAPGGAAWRGAKILDLDGDGALDVLAWSDQAMDVFRGTTAATSPNNIVYPIFSRASFPIDGNITHVATGDIDADGNVDIALSVRGDSSGLPTDALYVIFGRKGAPEDPRFLGRLNDVQHLTLGQVSWLLQGKPDRFQSIIPTGRTASGVPFGAALQGSTDRTLVSRFGLVSTQNSYIRDVGLSAVVGKFVTKDASALVSLGFGTERQDDDRSSTKQSSRLWLVPVSGSADFDSLGVQSSTPFAEKSLNVTASAPNFLAQLNRAALAAVDLDKDGIDEVVAFIPNAAGFDGGRILVAKPGAFDSIKPNSVKGQLRELDFVPFDFGGAGRVRVALGDFDGNGQKDILVYSTDTSQAPRIFLNTGNGKIDPTQSVEVKVAPGNVAFGATKAGELAVASDRSLSFFRVEKGVLRPTARAKVSLGAAGATSVAFGDVNGDGVEDLTVGFTDAAEVHLGEAVNP